MYFLNRNGIGGYDASEVKGTVWKLRDALHKAYKLLDKLREGL